MLYPGLAIATHVQYSVDKEILKQLKYVVIHSEKDTMCITFELLFEGHITDSTIYDL